MTKKEIQYLIGTLAGETLNDITPLNSVMYITLDKFENKFQDIKSLRFKFDMDNEVLVCYRCRPYKGEIPSNWVLKKHYDTFGGGLYKYNFDPQTMEPYEDVYDFESIKVIGFANNEVR